MKYKWNFLLQKIIVFFGISLFAKHYYLPRSKILLKKIGSATLFFPGTDGPETIPGSKVQDPDS
jgi:hypothetical protein